MNFKHAIYWTICLYVLLSLLGITESNAYAEASEDSSPNFICQEAASQKFEDVVSTCGVGEDRLESEARAKALENITREFKALCSLSSDCKNHLITIQPQRNYCKKSNGGFICYRLVVFTIQKEIDLNPTEEEIAKAKSKVLKMGITKKEVVALIGEPGDVSDKFGYTVWHYDGDICQQNRGCSIIFHGDILDSHMNFKIKFTNYMGE